MAARLNLICHGMMLFNEDNDQTIRIVIPSINPPHQRRYGSPARGTFEETAQLPNGDYSLTGVAPVAGSLIGLVGAQRYFCVKASEVTVNWDIARGISAIITVPMPEEIRVMRAFDMPDLGLVLQTTGAGTAYTVQSASNRLNDILCLSYPSLPAGRRITLDVPGGVFDVTTVDGGVYNWCLYSQEAELQSSAHVHRPTVNDFLSWNHPSRGPQPTDYRLSDLGPKDPPVYDPVAGIPAVYLYDLVDLQGFPLVTSKNGCTGVARG